MSRATATLRRIARVRAVETRLGRLRLGIAMQDQHRLSGMADRIAVLRSDDMTSTPRTGAMLRVHGEMATRLDDAAHALVQPLAEARAQVANADAQHMALLRREQGVDRKLAEAMRDDAHMADLRAQSLFRRRAGGVV
jgi:hypothetical protein